MNFVLGYLAVAGGISAGLQVTRGVVRGVTRLVEGEPRGALGEVVGGVLAPAGSVLKQGRKLAGEIYDAVATIAGCGEDESAADGVPG